MRSFNDFEYRVIKACKGTLFRGSSTLTREKLVFECSRQYAYKSYHTLHCEVRPEGDKSLRVIVNGLLPCFDGGRVGFRYYDLVDSVVDYGSIPVRDLDTESETYYKILGTEPAKDERELECELHHCLRRIGDFVEEMCRGLGFAVRAIQGAYKINGSLENYTRPEQLII